MNRILKVEELAQMLVGIYFFYEMDWSWWWFIGLIFAPDLSMIGYLFNTKTGAFLYNLFHHKALALFIGLIGYFSYTEPLLLAGIILFTHSAMDRVFGYGLKYPDSFKHTHLGWIGKKAD